MKRKSIVGLVLLVVSICYSFTNIRINVKSKQTSEAINLQSVWTIAIKSKEARVVVAILEMDMI